MRDPSGVMQRAARIAALAALAGSLVGVGACATRVGQSAPAAPAAGRGSAPAARDGAERGPSSDPVIEVEPLRVEVVTGDSGEREVEIYDARELFDQAVAAQEGGSTAQAVEQYDRLLAHFPDSALASAALFNAGLALETAGDREGAIARYRELARRAPGSRDARDAQIRAGAVLVELGRFGDALSALDELLAHSDLADADRGEVLARRGQVLVETRSYPEAEKTLTRAIEHLTRASRSRPLDSGRYRAMSQYLLGEIPRRQAAAIPLRLPDQQLRKDLEAKAALILLAQDRFQKAIDLGNVEWALAAGFQMASMQEEMWRALVTAPVPPELTAEESRLYIDQVRGLARAHLGRALELYSQTLAAADRLETSSPWTDRSRGRVQAVTELLARDARGEAPVPAEPGPDPARPPFADPDHYVPGRVEL